MQAQLSALVAKAATELPTIRTRPEFEAAKARFVGPNGELTTLMKQMGGVPKEERPAVGRLINEAKGRLQAELDTALRRIEETELAAQLGPAPDPTLPSPDPGPGTRHPLTQVREEMCRILRKVGFTVADGPEVETEFYCFDALNTPSDHPARDAQDTFYFPASARFGNVAKKNPEEKYLLRTHTSSVQIRTMLQGAPPIRIVSPGRVYRRDTSDATHSANFHQLECLCVDRGVTVRDLKALLDYVFAALLGPGTKTRFRPHYFSYTEPSFEVDLSARHLPKVNKEWIEIGGCGLVDPTVFSTVGYDPAVWTGYAFGMGLERLAMLLYGIDDIRYFYQNDLRFLKQFRLSPVKISLNWLKDYVALDAPVDELTRAITFLGFEVEQAIALGAPRLDQVVVGEVLTREKHPNADKLSVCSVDLGPAGGVKTIVCGAQNYQVGDRVPVALPGAVLPGNFTIKQSKIRGQLSDGMMCSAAELGLGEDRGGLLILADRPALGLPLNDVLPPGDTVFDLEITPNRPDCLSHLGMARELAAWFRLELKYPELRGHDADVTVGERDGNIRVMTHLTEVRVDASADCPLYIAHRHRRREDRSEPRLAAGKTHVGRPAPDQQRGRRGQLRHARIRPAAACVRRPQAAGRTDRGAPRLRWGKDRHPRRQGACAQPAHARDRRCRPPRGSRRDHGRGKFRGRRRHDRPGPGMRDFPGRLDPRDLPAPRTFLRFLLSVRARRRSPFGARSGRPSPGPHSWSTAGGRPVGPIFTVGGEAPWTREIAVTSTFVRERLGFDIPEPDMRSALESLELAVRREEPASEGGLAWTVSIPSWRDDLDRPIDLVEEILRLHGTERIPPAVVTSPGLAAEDDPVVLFNRRATDYLVGHDFHECVNLTLRSAREVATWVSETAAQELSLSNPFVEDQSHLRPTLITGLLESLKLNQSRGVAVSRLAETGRIFIERNGHNFECAAVAFLVAEDPARRWLRREPMDFYGVKHHLAALAGLAGIDLERQPLEPVSGAYPGWQEGHAVAAGDMAHGWSARFGLLNLGLVKSLGVEGKVQAGIFAILPESLHAPAARRRFAEFGLFPAALRDLSLVVPADTPAAEVEKALAEAARGASGSAFALESLAVFDVYHGAGLPEGRKSLTFSLVFRRPRSDADRRGGQHRLPEDSGRRRAGLRLSHSKITPCPRPPI